MRYKILLFIIIIVLTSGCSNITKEKAEKKALDFVNKNVKFFSKKGDSRLNISSYNLKLNSYKSDGGWIVIMQVSTKMINETKQNSIAVKIDSKGYITEFNGVRLEEPIKG